MNQVASEPQPQQQQGSHHQENTDTARTTTFLTLGDGDFTYSLDLARYLAASSVPSSTNHNLKTKIQLIATGIDTSEQLVAKYKDTPFVLQQLQQQLQQQQSGTTTSSSSLLTVSIQHGVNAIPPTNKDDGKRTTTTTTADHVMFHHPHLGTEDAVLHGRFLCHLMDAATHYWMKPKGGVFHLTLVQGQYERWECHKAAHRHGLVLLQRVPFVPPPVVLENVSPTYQYRRHQTGKSFASRRPMSGSETFTFGRAGEEGMVRARCLPWQEPTMAGTTTTKAVDNESSNTDTLSCSFCDKVFREERSRKCHMRDKHPDGADKKQKTTSSSTTFQCQQCPIESGDARSFVSDQALEDHVRAKHSAIHKQILPDWPQPQGGNNNGKKQGGSASMSDDPASADHGQGEDFGMCSICGLKYRDADHNREHHNEFIPTEASDSFQCSFCVKTFREERGKLQHENFCSTRFTKTN